MMPMLAIKKNAEGEKRKSETRMRRKISGRGREGGRKNESKDVKKG
jgi:hypothetical protein